MTVTVAALPENAVAGWTLRPVANAAYPARRTTRTYTASRDDGGPEIGFAVHRVPDHPLRACYPFGAHDLALSLAPPAPAPAATVGLLQGLVPALFTADPHCRRVIAAPDENDTAAQLLLEQGGFIRVAEADLPQGSVVLYAVEPPGLAGLSTALDDMPH